MEGVQVGRRAGIQSAVGVAVLVCQAQQHGVLDRAGLELALQLVVDGERVERFIGARVIAVQLRAVGPAVAVDLLERDVGRDIPRVLAERPAVVEAVVELIAEDALVALEFVVVGIGIHEMARDALARMVVGDAGVRRHAAVEAAAGLNITCGAMA
ncbi:hypothetical protein G6F68_017064 [Rhizopus microsporus]|nr:hypothetical protein G6F68_017064 [Rhizopus microsporus]